MPLPSAKTVQLSIRQLWQQHKPRDHDLLAQNGMAGHNHCETMYQTTTFCTSAHTMFG